jgi:type IV pilus assembly protein PilX
VTPRSQHTDNFRRRTGQAGFALITGLLLLLVLTIISVAMFHGFGTEEQIAGNTREKQRALNAAISAEQYAEWWLDSGNAPGAAACPAGIVPSTSGEVCNTVLPDFSQVPWTTGVQFTQFNQTIAASGKTGPTVAYYQPPVFYITFLGTSAGLGGSVYQIDAYGYGANSNTVAVVQSTYVLSNGDWCGSCE